MPHFSSSTNFLSAKWRSALTVIHVKQQTSLIYYHRCTQWVICCLLYITLDLQVCFGRRAEQREKTQRQFKLMTVCVRKCVCGGWGELSMHVRVEETWHPIRRVCVVAEGMGLADRVFHTTQYLSLKQTTFKQSNF